VWRAKNAQGRRRSLYEDLPLSFNFDATDLAIVEQLRENGRATNQQIAKTLGLTGTTISTRIRRMEEADQLRIIAESDFAARGYDLLLRVTLEVEGRAASDVAQELAPLPEVVAVHLVTGRYDIDMLVALRDPSELGLFLLDTMGQIKGIRSICPAIIVDIVKYQFDAVPIMPEN
jgi:Lrp/AsnC family leucine-responsive transcriptional regulator